MADTPTKRRPLVSQRELARRLDVTVRTVQNAVDRGMPRHRKGSGWGYDVDECRRWRKARQRARKAERKRGSEPRTDLDRARLAKASALCRRSETALAKLRESTLPAEVLEELLEESIAKLRLVAEPLPARWAPRFVGIESMRAAHVELRDYVGALFAALRGPDPDEDDAEIADPPEWEAPRTLNEARARRWNADAEAIELRSAVDDGVLVTFDDLEDRFRAAAGALRGAIMSMPSRLPAELMAVETEAEVRTVLANALAAGFAEMERER